uniref:Uncharacterized protein n=1 Tax=Prymnesium polylepis TaxID=72548 RepID=A0A7S4HWV2_9EUKA|mmetsp:Transcript_23455/g.57875  ORF Transcript_23455/g.57875 Transcript_23455/m.57875 type:complete len:168 (+) Transcript_23455:89-592(+)
MGQVASGMCCSNPRPGAARRPRTFDAPQGGFWSAETSVNLLHGQPAEAAPPAPSGEASVNRAPGWADGIIKCCAACQPPAPPPALPEPPLRVVEQPPIPNRLADKLRQRLTMDDIGRSECWREDQRAVAAVQAKKSARSPSTLATTARRDRAQRPAARSCSGGEPVA